MDELTGVIEDVCRKYNFEYSLKPEQIAAIKSILEGKDTFISLPTGFGKSMCYVLPPLVSSLIKKNQATALVVTPFKTIMQDQKTTLKEHGVKVAVLLRKEDMDPEDGELVKSGNVDVIFCTPESAFASFSTLISDLLQVIY